MSDELDLALTLLKENKLDEARSWFNHVLFHTKCDVEEKLCTRHLKDINARISELQSISTISIDSTLKENLLRECTIKFVSREAAHRDLAQKIFTAIHKHSYASDSSIKIVLHDAGLTLVIHGKEKDSRCTLCAKFRNKLKDNLGKDGFWKEGKCPFQL
ncbi:MAG: hypothetical protein P9M13_09545 [Candidatus Ancaeobacter aquaticus]|nr:hypothetical protein [Candidatus Ancaeobacter aquaticus]